MKLNSELIKKMKELKQSEEKYSQFVGYMEKNGVPKLQYSQLNKLSKKVNDLITVYFNENDKLEKGETKMNEEINNNEESAITTALAPTGTEESNVIEIKVSGEQQEESQEQEESQDQKEIITTDTTETQKTPEEEDNENKDAHEDFNLNDEHTDLKNEQKRQDRKEEKLTDAQKNARDEKKFKTVDNLIQFTPKKHTHLNNVIKISEDRYGIYLDADTIAQLFLDGNLVFDPTMQRGTKEDKQGIHAFFKESHVNDIYDSIVDETYTPTQIMWGVIIDEGDELVYNKEDNSIDINGKLRLLDGQHRTRAFVKVKTWLFTGKLQKQIDLSNIITNIEIHAKTGNGARQIYTNIDKNMKLNQAQVQQLSHSVESQITNYLNQSDDSKMKGKIATSRPVGKKLCLFNTITDVLKKYGNIELDEVAQYKEYLKNFFNYLVTVLPDAFGKDEDKRVEFRKDNLINENNMFKAWVRLALADKEHFKENIDKVIANVDYYKKDNKVWLDGTTTKVRKKKDAQTGEKVPCGFSMNNTSTAFETLYDETFKIAGIEK